MVTISIRVTDARGKKKDALSLFNREYRPEDIKAILTVLRAKGYEKVDK